MIEKLIKAGATVLALAILAACGGENGPETGKPVETGASGNATVAAPPTRTPETEPARAQRLDHLLPSPTTKPEAKTAKTTVTTTDAAETKAVGKPTPTGETESATAPAIPRLNITDLAPENPQTNDQVLLQDIYGQIDLEQFALDPDEPIPFVELRGPNQVSLMRYPEVHEHPYLHLFPELKHMASQSERDISYIPFMSVDSDTFHEQRNHFDLAALHNGPTYFIYNPWFEQLQYKNPDRRFTPYSPLERKRLGRQAIEPYWFGHNSTRGILAETVVKLLEEAKLPSAEPYPRDWWTQKEYQPGRIYIEEDSFAPRDWTLDEYIRTGVQYPGPEARSFKHWQVEFHNIPQITWEFLDPELPILHVTAHAQQRLPLTDPASPEQPEVKRYPSKNITRYSVSFVMSLQNRWTSFDDPDRWIVRFGEDLELYLAPPHHVDRGQGKGASYIPDYWNDNDLEQSRYELIKRFTNSLAYTPNTELTYPNYWDDTDYMQHRIIGPVVLTVHESPVLQPGTYSRIPRISQWEAPGHILTEEQVQKIPLANATPGQANTLLRESEQDTSSGSDDWLKKTIFEVWPNTYRPNAGFPLPGHVMATPLFGPGTETWKEYGMESWEEYDRSLNKK